eukprot:g4509.t1
MIHDVDRLKNIMRGAPGEGSHSKSIKNKHQRRSRSRSRTGSYGIVDPNLLPSMFEDAGASVKEEGLREKRITSPVGRATRYGDLFGTHGSYAEGMLYRSRLGPDKNAVLAVRKGSPGLARLARQSDGARAIASKRTTEISPEERNNEESFKAVFRTKVGSKSSDLESHRDAANAVLVIQHLSRASEDTRKLLVAYAVVDLLQKFSLMPSETIASNCAVSLCSLAEIKGAIIDDLISDGAIEVVKNLLEHGARDSFSLIAPDTRERCAIILLNLLVKENSRSHLAECGALQFLSMIADGGNASDHSIDTCTQAILLLCLDEDVQHATGVTDAERASVAEPKMSTALPDNAEYVAMLDSGGHDSRAEVAEMAKLHIPQVVSHTRGVEWKTWSFQCEPLCPPPIVLRQEPDAAPRWMPHAAHSSNDRSSDNPAAGEAIEGVRSGQGEEIAQIPVKALYVDNVVMEKCTSRGTFYSADVSQLMGSGDVIPSKEWDEIASLPPEKSKSEKEEREKRRNLHDEGREQDDSVAPESEGSISLVKEPDRSAFLTPPAPGNVAESYVSSLLEVCTDRVNRDAGGTVAASTSSTTAAKATTPAPFLPERLSSKQRKSRTAVLDRRQKNDAADFVSRMRMRSDSVAKRRQKKLAKTLLLTIAQVSSPVESFVQEDTQDSGTLPRLGATPSSRSRVVGKEPSRIRINTE